MGVQGKNIKRFSLAQMTWEDLSEEQGLRQEMELTVTQRPFPRGRAPCAMGLKCKEFGVFKN